MITKRVQRTPDRREFLKGVASAGALLCFWPIRSLAQTAPPAKDAKSFAFDFQFRSVSVEHLAEVKEWYQKLDQEGKLSKNATFRKYIGGFTFKPPDELPGAKSMLIVSYQLRLSSITFHKDGKRYDILIPCGYADDGVPEAVIVERIKREALKDPGAKMAMQPRVPHKTLAVRSGLAEYGKNNITFVEKYGSFHQLLVYFTEKKLPDQWGPLKVMRLCKGCTICPDSCPTKCFSDNNFVIDVGRCLPLYNEVPDPMPEWIDPKVHHTLAGCLKCQAPCPANKEFLGTVNHLADITEEETNFLLSGKRDEKVEKGIIAKLAWFPAAKDIPYFSRNLRLAMANATPA